MGIGILDGFELPVNLASMAGNATAVREHILAFVNSTGYDKVRSPERLHR